MKLEPTPKPVRIRLSVGDKTFFTLEDWVRDLKECPTESMIRAIGEPAFIYFFKKIAPYTDEEVNILCKLASGNDPSIKEDTLPDCESLLKVICTLINNKADTIIQKMTIIAQDFPKLCSILVEYMSNADRTELEKAYKTFEKIDAKLLQRIHLLNNPEVDSKAKEIENSKQSKLNFETLLRQNSQVHKHTDNVLLICFNEKVSDAQRYNLLMGQFGSIQSSYNKWYFEDFKAVAEVVKMFRETKRCNKQNLHYPKNSRLKIFYEIQICLKQDNYSLFENSLCALREKATSLLANYPSPILEGLNKIILHVPKDRRNAVKDELLFFCQNIFDYV